MALVALILIAHGSRSASWGEPFRELAQATETTIAFMEMASPSIEEATERVVRQGAQSIYYLPLFMAVGRHVKNDIPSTLAALRERYPTVNIELLSALGQSSAFWEILREFVRAEVRTLTLGKTV